MPRTHLDKLKNCPPDSESMQAGSSALEKPQEESRDYVKISADYLADIVEGKTSLEEQGVTTKVKAAELLLRAGELLKGRTPDGVTIIFEGENEILD